MIGEDLHYTMLIAARCRQEGQQAALDGLPVTACGYEQELERAAWLDGWGRGRWSLGGPVSVQVDEKDRVVFTRHVELR